MKNHQSDKKVSAAIKTGIAVIVVIAAYKLFKKLIFLIHTGANEAASIGIIGGVDGPTAIFITTKINPVYMTALVIAGLFAIIALSIVIYKKKKR